MFILSTTNLKKQSNSILSFLLENLQKVLSLLYTDFLNYINHCYVFDESVFGGNKFHRTTSNIPIIACLPKGSNISEEEEVRGISMDEWRSEYLSIHLKGGAPAFSPNNMRLPMKEWKKFASQHYEQKGGCKNNKKKQYKPK
jgi:hypothetical protein